MRHCVGFPWHIELPWREQRGTQERQDAQWWFEQAVPTHVCSTRGLLEVEGCAHRVTDKSGFLGVLLSCGYDGKSLLNTSNDYIILMEL